MRCSGLKYRIIHQKPQNDKNLDNELPRDKDFVTGPFVSMEVQKNGHIIKA